MAQAWLSFVWQLMEFLQDAIGNVVCIGRHSGESGAELRWWWSRKDREAEGSCVLWYLHRSRASFLPHTTIAAPLSRSEDG
jgi:hypothetical protein